MTWQTPGVSGDQYSNSLKNLVDIAKWLYSLIIINRAPYSIQDLIKIFSDLSYKINALSFPEANLSSVKPTIISDTISAISKLK